jgi:hypothetical protein
VFLESVDRYNGIFRHHPPTKFAQFVERVPIVEGRLDDKATTATGYAWFVWKKNVVGPPCFMWIPPCRKQLEAQATTIFPEFGRRLEPSGMPRC